MIAVLLLGTNKGSGLGQFQLDEPAPRSLFSPLEMTLIDEAATEKLRQNRSKGVLPVFQPLPEVTNKLSQQKTEFFDTFQRLSELEAELQKSALAEISYELTPDTVQYLLNSSNLSEVKGHVESFQEITQAGILTSEDYLQVQIDGSSMIALVTETEEKNITLSSFYTLEKLKERVDSQFSTQGLFSKNKPLKKVLFEIIPLFFEPTLEPDALLTQTRRDEAQASVVPVEITIKKNELIIQRGRLVTGKAKERIDAVQSKLKKREVLNRITATSLIVVLAYFLLFVYLYEFEKASLVTWKNLLLIHSVFLLTGIFSKVIAVWPGSSLYLMPTALAALLLAMLIGPRFGMVSAFMMSVMAGIVTEFQVDIVFATLLASIAGAFTAFRVRKRLEFLKVGVAVGGTWFVVLFAFQFFQEYALTEAVQHSALGLANGLLVTIPICFLLLPLFENTFNLTTDITLLELSDLNHPLLKRMIVEAPGTYHHSLVVSTLAEAACERVGANALLARVGCYFHDIGKIAQAEFFTENMRANRKSVHENLTPEESFNIINQHVIGGIALGKQHKLKEPILRFIPEHQGTGVIWYFYRKAVDQAKPGQDIHPDDYRYAGPKPQSRETAVAMLADSCEAASRSLKEPTPDNLRNLVRKIINDKFIDGQLDECDLTLKDLHNIQASFVTNLMAILSHSRELSCET